MGAGSGFGCSCGSDAVGSTWALVIIIGWLGITTCKSNTKGPQKIPIPFGGFLILIIVYCNIKNPIPIINYYGPYVRETGEA